MTARRSYGTGALIARSGVYFGKWRDANGRQVMRKLGPARTPHTPDGLTKRQAEERLRELIRTTTASVPRDTQRTVSAAADAWLAHLLAMGAKQSTIRAYRAPLNAWLLPMIGDRSLDRVQPEDVEDIMRRMAGHGLTSKTIRNYVAVLSSLYTFACHRSRRWAITNPVHEVELPKLPTYTEILYLTTSEVWTLVDNVPASEYRPLDRALYMTAAMTGLRIGELQALDWRSIDLMHGRVRVRRTWDRKAREYTTPKSRRSQRAVPMPDDVATELLRMHAHYNPDALEPDPDALVFADPHTGEAMGWRRMYDRLRAALTAAGLDASFGFHALRHSYGTAMAAAGVPMRTLQEWMGHRDIQTTQRYADYCPNPAERDVVAAAFTRPLSTNPSTNLPHSEVPNSTQAHQRAA